MTVRKIRDLPTRDRLVQLATQIRRLALITASRAGGGHPGADLSVADILAALFFSVLLVDPSNPGDPERDRFVLSKGHAAASLYSTLALRGFLPVEELSTFLQPNSRLGGHPSHRHLPVIEASTGPLGHGLPIAVGMALAARLDRSTRSTFVLTGDGELEEGSNWEAIMLAAHYRLANLTLIVDRNGMQQGDTTEATVRLEPLAAKLEAFGWTVQAVDGHDPAALVEALSRSATDERPKCVLARTHKGRGVSFMEDQPGWHNKVISEDDLQRALAELGGS